MVKCQGCMVNNAPARVGGGRCPLRPVRPSQAGTKRALILGVKLDGEYKVDMAVGMCYRHGVEHVMVRWQVFAAEGDTWEPLVKVHPWSKVQKFIDTCETEHAMTNVRAGILNTMLGKTIKDRRSRYQYSCAIDQICYDSIGITVIEHAKCELRQKRAIKHPLPRTTWATLPTGNAHQRRGWSLEMQVDRKAKRPSVYSAAIIQSEHRHTEVGRKRGAQQQR